MHVRVSTMAVALTSPKRVYNTYLFTHCSLSVCSRLLHRCDERRVLHSSATSDAWSILKQASSKLFPVNAGTLFPADAYLCRVPCVCSIEKLIKLKESLRKEEHDLRENIIEMGHFFPTKNCSTTTFGALLVRSTLSSWPPRLWRPE